MALTVKQVAQRTDLPSRTVRYYDQIGLVSPQARSEAGYRLYGPEDEGRLRFVRQAKTIGLTLDEVRQLIAAAERGCCGEVVPELDRVLTSKIVEIDAQIDGLVAFRERLIAYQADRSGGCGCRGHSAFCACLDEARPTQTQTKGRDDMACKCSPNPTENDEHAGAESGGCGCGPDGGGCGPECSCGNTPDAASESDRLNAA